ncbi:MAG: DEAD/DEAH box helicase family protein [Bradymonadia bacterium]
MPKVSLSFEKGTVLVRGGSQLGLELPQLTHDPRNGTLRGRACHYRVIVERLIELGVDYEDDCQRYERRSRTLSVGRVPRDYQAEALEAWRAHGQQGCVILPTGAGKTYVAMLAIQSAQRNTLIVAPTLELVRQWYDELRLSFREDVGIVGGGEHTVCALTVTTYDSAHIHMEHMGNRFGLIVFDECHHLPSEAYQFAAEGCLAPFRLGLSATPERSDGRESMLTELIGPMVYRKEVTDLAGLFLSEYVVETVYVRLSDEEMNAYTVARQRYLAFVRSRGIRFNRKGAWNEFIRAASRSKEGLAALEAHREQRRLAHSAPSKLDYVETLLRLHQSEKTIIFTNDNETAYAVSRRFLLPIITHQTKVSRRSEILEQFKTGLYQAVVTSKVLNEGIDVPAASVAIILSGSGSVREHVQRLGRILRKAEDKQAVLYELVAEGTAEMNTSNRRREHNAYR